MKRRGRRGKYIYLDDGITYLKLKRMGKNLYVDEFGKYYKRIGRKGRKRFIKVELLNRIKKRKRLKKKYKKLTKVIIGIIIVYLIYANLDFISPHFQDLKGEVEEASEIFKSEPERYAECMGAFDYLNNIRLNNGKRKLVWDDRLYALAVFRSKDMWEREYFDHVTPEGTCVKDFKLQFGISSNEILAENCGGMTYYSKGDVDGNCKETIDDWMTSRGHRYNLLYSEHIKGAIGCYYETCVFYGLHTDSHGLGAGECTTGAEGSLFWRTAPEQEGEI